MNRNDQRAVGEVQALRWRKLIDARERFRPAGLEYKVQIKVEVTAGLLWAIAKCLCQRKDLRITHTFTNDPILSPFK